MGNNSTFGPLVRKAIGWVLVVAVAILLLKIVLAVIVGFVQTLIGIVLLVAVLFAVVWALRKL